MIRKNSQRQCGKPSPRSRICRPFADRQIVAPHPGQWSGVILECRIGGTEFPRRSALRPRGPNVTKPRRGETIMAQHVSAGIALWLKFLNPVRVALCAGCAVGPQYASSSNSTTCATRALIFCRPTPARNCNMQPTLAVAMICGSTAAIKPIFSSRTFIEISFCTTL
jgi:hypothetical protein